MLILSLSRNRRNIVNRTFKFDASIIPKFVTGGRCRWKIENETFNTLKNQGYHLDHNFGQKSRDGFAGDRYRYVRNPIAVAGVVQGIAVGWYLGSYAVIVYSLAGAVLWHVAVRPVEEAGLNSRFGKTYNEYQQRVRLWIPTLD